VLQTVSLVSRRARCSAHDRDTIRRRLAPSITEVQVPRTFRLLGLDRMKLCSCSWSCEEANRSRAGSSFSPVSAPRRTRSQAKPVQVVEVKDERRLCQRRTEDHDEFRLLALMNSYFHFHECETGADNITVSAVEGKTDVSWMMLDEGTSLHVAVGYIAIRNGFQHKVPFSSGEDVPKEVPLLLQIYTEETYRRRGYASQALREKLAQTHAIAVDSPTQWMLKMLAEKLGFTVFGHRRYVGGEIVLLLH